MFFLKKKVFLNFKPSYFTQCGSKDDDVFSCFPKPDGCLEKIPSYRPN